MLRLKYNAIIHITPQDEVDSDCDEHLENVLAQEEQKIDKMNKKIDEMERQVQRKKKQLKKKQELKIQLTLKRKLKKRLDELKKEYARLNQEICEVGKITFNIVSLNTLVFFLNGNVLDNENRYVCR